MPFQFSKTANVILVVACMLLAGRLSAQPGTLPSRIIVGYWHNFDNGTGAIRLANVPAAYDVIDVAFAEPSSGATIAFVPLASLYTSNRQFADEVRQLQMNGKKVLLSIGGANAVVQLKTSTDVQNFVSSVSTLISTFGFDGIDLDLEGTSLVLDAHDTDFRKPTTPTIVNLINAISQVLTNFPGGLILSAAPETAGVQGGYVAYSGIYGAYLPLIYALKDQFTYIHVQDYNTGSMYGRDGVIYQPGTSDFLVAMADMLISGFTVEAFTAKIPFPGLGADKVLIGLPATTDAAGSGFMPFPLVRNALDYLYTGRTFGGAYAIASPQGYNHFRGVMTWSINWDVYDGLSWSPSYRQYLDTLVTSVPLPLAGSDGTPRRFALEQNYPNPFNPTTVVSGQWTVNSVVRLAVYDLLGREVAVLANGRYPAGRYSFTFDGKNLASGVYFYHLTAGSYSAVRKMLLER